MRSRLPILVLPLALAAAGCAAFSDDTGGGTASGDRPTIVAAFYPLEYVASRIAGDHADIEMLTPAGGEPHDLELSVRETALISDADLVIFEAGFQPAVDDSVEQNATGATLDAAEYVDLLPFEEGEEHDEHGEDEHADEGEEHSGEEGHDEHDHGEFDPHFWQDPHRMADLGDAVAAELSDLDPDNADAYASAATDLRADLEALATEYTDTLANCVRNTIVVSHDAYGYLEQFGIHLAPIAGLSPEAEPTPADLAELQELIDTEGITTVFNERLGSPEQSEQLAADTGVKVEVLDPIEGLTDETADEDYLSLMEANLAAIAAANECA